MRLTDLARTSAFRITLLFSLLLISAVTLLFGAIYWRSADYLTRQVDRAIHHEMEEFLAQPPQSRARNIEAMIQDGEEGDWYGAYFAPDSQRLAGNLDFWSEGEISGRIFDVKRAHLADGGYRRHLRVVQQALSDGGKVVIARRAEELHKVREAVWEATLSGLIGAVALALAGGLVMSFATLRRIEAIHRSTTAIVNGDLSQRLPTNGSNDDFDKLSGIVNVMLADIERLIGDIKSAGDNIAHDLRTPLTRLRTRLEGALRRGGALEDHRAAMEDAIGELDQILATFRALLRISEIEAGQRRAGFTDVDLAKLATEAAELFEPVAADRGLGFSVEIEPAAVRGDPDLLFEALANLLDNAMKFTPSGGSIALALTRDGVLSVTDNGPGLPAELGDKIFRRFSRGDKSRHLPGNGLGLSLVSAVLALHGFSLVTEDAKPGCRMRIVPSP